MHRVVQGCNLPFEIHEMQFESREHALNWMIANQLGRRNLNPNQIAYLRGKRYENEKKMQGAPIGNRNAEKQSGNIYHFEKPKTSEDLASEYGVSEKTIRNNAIFAKAVDCLPREKKQSVLSGEEPMYMEEARIVAKMEKPIQKKFLKEVEQGTPIKEAIKKIDPEQKRKADEERIRINVSCRVIELS